MKKLLLLLFFMTTIAIAGIPLSTNFTVNTALPIDDRMSVADTTARDAIPALKRWEGMLVYSIADGKHYTLIGGITNGDWSELSGGGGNLVSWVTATPYVIGNTVIESNRIYVCVVDHTSGTFATDLTAVKWVELSSGVELTGNQTIAGNKTFSDVTLLGYPAGEPTGVNVNGTTNESSLIVSDVASTKEAQTILHRHSTTLEPLILSARSNSDADIEGDVVANQNMFSLLGTGWKTDNYKVFGSMNIAASTLGTLSSTSAPGKVLINTTPNGATVPTAHLTLESDKSSTFEGDIITKGNLTAANFQNQNLLVNPSFESSEADDYAWSTSGATISTSTPSVDGRALQLSLTGLLDINQEVGASAAAFDGVQMVASTYIKTILQDVFVCALTNAIESDCTKVAGSGKFEQVIIPFIGNATSNGIKVKTISSTSGTVHVDNAFVGTSAPFQGVNGAKLVGTVTITGCTSAWSTASTSFVDFSATTGCTYTTSGQALAPSTNIPAIKFASLPPGDYKLEYEGWIGADTVNRIADFQFWDGTNTAREISGFYGSASTVDTNGINQSISYSSTQTNVTLSIRGRTLVAGTAYIGGNNSTRQGVIKVWYFPPESKIYSQNINDYEATQEFVAAITTTTGAKTDENIPWISSCTAANPTVCTFNTNLKDGINPLSNALKCTYSSASGGNVASVNSTSTTLTIGTFTTNGSQTAAGNVQVVVHCSKIGTDYNARNVIVGSFAGIEKCANDYECTDTFSATVSSAGVVSNENLDWISGNCTVSATSQFDCPLIGTLKDGTSGLSSKLNCIMSSDETTFDARYPAYDSANSTTSNVRLRTQSSATGVAVAYGFLLKCQKGTNDYKPKTAKVASSIGVPTVPGITTSGTGNLIDTFSVSYGTTNATTVCSASPCSYLDQIGNAVTSVTRSGTGAYSLNLSKTYSKLKCTGTVVSSAVSVGVIGGNGNIASCVNCSSALFSTNNTSTGAQMDTSGTLYCIGSY